LVIGPSFIHKRQFEADKNEKLKLYYNPLMSELMLACDAAISGCGSTLYELAACGTPTIGILAADNQKMAAEKMKSLGVILFARDVEQIPDCIRRLSFEKRSEMSRTGQGLVDGMGAARLAEEINMIVSNKVQNALEATLP
jgi:spore coat polysaccharide biosynthesis predicted glycosyltransferase SpsG